MQRVFAGRLPGVREIGLREHQDICRAERINGDRRLAAIGGVNAHQA
jgi:hypothetical protein